MVAIRLSCLAVEWNCLFRARAVGLGTLLCPQHGADCRQQELRPVGFGHEAIHSPQSPVGQFQILGNHDYWKPGSDPLDLIRHAGSIEEALKYDSIHRPRHHEPQSISPIACGNQFVSLFPQQVQLAWLAVYAQQCLGSSHIVRL